MSETTEPLLEEDDVDSTSEEAEDSGPVAKRARGTGKSGWCLEFSTDGHERCPITVGSFTCTCTCTNHGTRAGQPQTRETAHEPEEAA